MAERSEPLDGVPMRTFTATHTDVQRRMAEKVAGYLGKGLTRTDACRLARVSLRWTYYHKGLIDEMLRSRKAG